MVGHVHVRFMRLHHSMLYASHMLACRYTHEHSLTDSVCFAGTCCNMQVVPCHLWGDDGLVSPAATGRQLMV
jgi:hypothetical protein